MGTLHVSFNQSPDLVSSSSLISLLLFALKSDDTSATPACGCYLPHIFNLSVPSHFRSFFHKQNMAGFKILSQIWKSVLNEFIYILGFDLNILSCFWVLSICFPFLPVFLLSCLLLGWLSFLYSRYWSENYTPYFCSYSYIFSSYPPSFYFGENMKII